MSVSVVDGGPAFPTDNKEGDTHGGVTELLPWAGMTLRDYFASMAMAACIQANRENENYTANPAQAAEWAYQFADAMIAERAK